MAERARLRDEFLRAHGVDPAAAVALAADASFRSYFRTPAGVLMDAPPPREDVRPFVRVARHLAGIGLSAPEILAADPERGFLLLEDLGDDLFSRLLRGGAEAAPLYGAAVDMLVALARHPPPAGLAPYDMGPLMEEADLFLDWYLPDRGGKADGAARDSWREAWGEALAPALDGAPVLTLRDCHVDNLLRLPGRAPPADVGLLDFQDALAGHPAYDLASLLDDVRTEPDPGLGEAMTRRFLDATGFEEGPFRRAFDALSAQRSTKILGIFTRLARRDGKSGYLAWIPSTWRLLARRLAADGLAPVRSWFDRHVPPALRGDVP